MRVPLKPKEINFLIIKQGFLNAHVVSVCVYVCGMFQRERERIAENCIWNKPENLWSSR